jgi:hypothetical protein
MARSLLSRTGVIWLVAVTLSACGDSITGSEDSRSSGPEASPFANTTLPEGPPLQLSEGELEAWARAEALEAVRRARAVAAEVRSIQVDAYRMRATSTSTEPRVGLDPTFQLAVLRWELEDARAQFVRAREASPLARNAGPVGGGSALVSSGSCAVEASLLDDVYDVVEAMDEENPCFWAVAGLIGDLAALTVSLGLTAIACWARAYCRFSLLLLAAAVRSAIGGFNGVLRACGANETAESAVGGVCLEGAWADLMNHPDIDPAELAELQSAIEELCSLAGGGGPL